MLKGSVWSVISQVQWPLEVISAAGNLSTVKISKMQHISQLFRTKREHTWCVWTQRSLLSWLQDIAPEQFLSQKQGLLNVKNILINFSPNPNTDLDPNLNPKFTSRTLRIIIRIHVDCSLLSIFPFFFLFFCTLCTIYIINISRTCFFSAFRPK